MDNKNYYRPRLGNWCNNIQCKCVFRSMFGRNSLKCQMACAQSKSDNLLLNGGGILKRSPSSINFNLGHSLSSLNDDSVETSAGTATSEVTNTMSSPALEPTSRLDTMQSLHLLTFFSRHCFLLNVFFGLCWP